MNGEVSTTSPGSTATHDNYNMTEDRLSLALFIGSIGGGGAQRILCLFANAWAKAGHDVTVYHHDPTLTNFPFVQSPLVKVQRLSLHVPVRNRLMARVRLVKDAWLFRKVLSNARPKHDVVISFLPQANILALLACLGTKHPVIITELCHPEYDIIGKGWDTLRRWTYGLADKFIVQTRDIHDWFVKNIGQTPEIISNPIPDCSFVWQPSHHDQRKVIVAAARLTYQKNLTSLAAAFAQLAEKHPDWDLDIYGMGEEQATLEDIIHKNKLEGRLRLAGWTSNLGQVLAESEMFVLSSRFEGMPMALTEALAIGVPCISTDCPSGPADYITHGENGMLVPVDDVDALAKTMDTVMSDPSLRIRLSKNAKKISDCFGLEAILPLWNKNICDIIRNK